MRVYARTGRNSGVSVGLLGAVIALPFVAMYYMLILIAVLVWALFQVLKALVLWIAKVAHAELH